MDMYTYREQLETLSNVRMKVGDHRRMNCPFCGGRNTFSMSNTDGSLLWYCYKASCGVKGSKSVGRTPDQIRSRIAQKSVNPIRQSAPIPRMVSDPSHHPRVMSYLEQNSSVDAYNERWIDIRYTPADDRVLFYTPDRQGAVGRSLSGAKPKWKVYGDTSGILTVGTGRTMVLVEDAASACSVARLDDIQGGALLGTNMSPVQKAQLRGLDNVIIALDRDASRKALWMQAKIQGLVPVTVRFLIEDLKHLSVPQIRSIIQPN